jgi:hypothetical protein
MKRGLYMITILVSILLISLVSAGLLDSIKDALTGHATSQDTNVSVTVTGPAQVNVTVDNSTLDGGVTPVEDSSTTTYVNILVCDPNGVNDIDDSATEVSYVKVGEDTRSNTSCVLVSDVNSYCANFTCQVTMWYWDLYGTWTINATANDLGNQTAVYNDSYTFAINQLKALTISPAQLNWTAITPGDTNATANNDPTVVNNTGNYDGTLNITGLDLYGLITTAEVFRVSNFTAEVVNASCGTGDSEYLVNASQVLITGSLANPGNLSAGAGAGQEELYYCIPNVPQLSSQEYSTAQLGSWTVSY